MSTKKEIEELRDEMDFLIKKFTVDVLKGEVWKIAVQTLVEKHGITNDEVFAEVAAQIRAEYIPQVDDKHRAAMQDVLIDFLSEARSMIKKD